MTTEELHNLDRGDLVKPSGESRVFIVTGNYGGRVTAAATVDITNPPEWVLVRKASVRPSDFPLHSIDPETGSVRPVPCQTEDDCPTPTWCKGKDRCPKQDAADAEAWRDHFVLPIAKEMKARGITKLEITLKGSKAAYELVPKNATMEARES